MTNEIRRQKAKLHHAATGRWGLGPTAIGELASDSTKGGKGQGKGKGKRSGTGGRLSSGSQGKGW